MSLVGLETGDLVLQRSTERASLGERHECGTPSGQPCSPSIFATGNFVVQDRWRACVDLPDDCHAEASIHLRSLVIEDAGSEIDDGQWILDEAKTVNDSFDGLGLDRL